jgi:hypothetical protein
MYQVFQQYHLQVGAAVAANLYALQEDLEDQVEEDLLALMPEELEILLILLQIKDLMEELATPVIIRLEAAVEQLLLEELILVLVMVELEERLVYLHHPLRIAEVAEAELLLLKERVE